MGYDHERLSLLTNRVCTMYCVPEEGGVRTYATSISGEVLAIFPPWKSALLLKGDIVRVCRDFVCTPMGYDDNGDWYPLTRCEYCRLNADADTWSVASHKQDRQLSDKLEDFSDEAEADNCDVGSLGDSEEDQLLVTVRQGES